MPPTLGTTMPTRLHSTPRVGTILTTVAVIFTGLRHFDSKLAFDFPAGAFDFSLGFCFGLGAASLAAFGELGGAYLAIIGGTAALETTWIEAIEDVDLDDLNPESLWRFRIRDFGPLRVAMDSHGGSLYDAVDLKARNKREAVLATLGVKSR